MSSFFQSVGVVAKKELTELFRDVRSMVITVLVPVVLFPGLFVLLDTNMQQQRAIGREHQVIAVAPTLLRQWETDNGIPEALSRYSLVPQQSQNVASTEVLAELTANYRLRYNDRSEISTVGATMIATTLNAERNDNAAADPEQPQVVLEAIAPGAVRPGALLALAAVIPLFLLLASSVGPLPAALDLGAGEKQRQSLEFLLSATSHRQGLFLGKTIAVGVTGFLGVIGFVLGIVIAHRVAPEIFSTDTSQLNLTAGLLITMVAFIVLLVLLISVLELLLSVVARSPREAQGFFLPFLVLVSGIGYTALMTDVWYAPEWMIHTPLLNIALLLKMLVLGVDISAAAWWVFIENVVIIVAAGFLGGAVLRSEWVLQRS